MIVDLHAAANIILNQGIIIQATEGVFGFSALATSENGANSILNLKGREAKKGFIVLCRDIAEIANWVEPLSESQRKLITDDHGHPTTFLISKTKACPQYLCGEYSSLAVRIPKHKQMLDLLQQCAEPLISTSANLSGKPASTDLNAINKGFPNTAVLSPEIKMSGRPSRIIDLNSAEQIR